MTLSPNTEEVEKFTKPSLDLPTKQVEAVIVDKLKNIDLCDETHVVSSSIHVSSPPSPPIMSYNNKNEELQIIDTVLETESSSQFKTFGSGLVGSHLTNYPTLDDSTTTTTSSPAPSPTSNIGKRPLSAMEAARVAALKRREEKIQKLTAEDALYFERRQKSTLIGKIEACYAQMNRVSCSVHIFSLSF